MKNKFLKLSIAALLFSIATVPTVFAKTDISLSKPKLQNHSIQNLTVNVVSDKASTVEVKFLVHNYKGFIINSTTLTKKVKPGELVVFDGYSKMPGDKYDELSKPYDVKVLVTDADSAEPLGQATVEIENGFFKEEVVELIDKSFIVEKGKSLPTEARVKLNNGKMGEVNIIFMDTVDTSVIKKYENVNAKLHSDKYGYDNEVTVTVEVVNGREIASIVEIHDTAIKGEQYKAPDTVETVYVDGGREHKPVAWEAIDTDTAGLKTVDGRVDGTDKKAVLKLNVIELDKNAKYTFINSDVEAVVREKLNKPSGDITCGDLLKIRELSFNAFSYYGNTDFSDLSHMTNLKSLELNNYSLMGVSVDFSFMSGLKKLEKLDLFSSGITDISVLRGMTELVELNLGSNEELDDIFALSSMTKLKVLNLSSTNVSDIYALKALVNLKELSLDEKKIEDLTPVARVNDNFKKPFNIKLMKSRECFVEIIKNIGEQYKLPYAIKDGDEIVFVSWSPREGEVTDGLQVNGVGENGKIYKAFFTQGDAHDKDKVIITERKLEERIRQAIDKPFGDILIEDIKNLKTLNLEAQDIKDFSVLKYMKGLEDLNLADNPSFGKYLGLIKDMKGMRDISLANCGITYINDETFKGLDKLHELTLTDNNILEITDGAFKTNMMLENLNIERANLSRLPNLNHLKNLHWLDAEENKLVNIDGIKEATELRELRLGQNRLSDISALRNLGKLTDVQLDYNRALRSIDALADKPELNILWMKHCSINDVGALKESKKLRIIYMDYNEVEDISVMESFTELWQLQLKHNRVKSVAPLKALIKLRVLWIDSNPIIDKNVLKDIYDNLTNKDFSL